VPNMALARHWWECSYNENALYINVTFTHDSPWFLQWVATPTGKSTTVGS